MFFYFIFKSDKVKIFVSIVTTKALKEFWNDDLNLFISDMPSTLARWWPASVFTFYRDSVSADRSRPSAAGCPGCVRPRTVVRRPSTARRTRTWPTSPDFITATARSTWPASAGPTWTTRTGFGRCRSEWQDNKIRRII